MAREDPARIATTPTDKPAGTLETPAPPSWLVRVGTHDADVAAMYAWVNARLDDIDAAFDVEQAELWDTQDWGPDQPQEEARRVWNFEIAKANARRGDFTQLRRMLPAFAEFLNPLHRKSGERRRYPDWAFKEERTRLAIDDYYRIRQLWIQHFGCWKRPDSDDVRAEAIAATRHGVTERKVREALKRGVPGMRYSARNLPSLR